MDTCPKKALKSPFKVHLDRKQKNIYLHLFEVDPKFGSQDIAFSISVRPSASPPSLRVKTIFRMISNNVMNLKEPTIYNTTYLKKHFNSKENDCRQNILSGASKFGALKPVKF